MVRLELGRDYPMNRILPRALLSLSQGSPGVQSLEIIAHQPLFTQDVPSNVLHQWNDLRSLRVGEIESRDVVAHLGTLPLLEDLSSVTLTAASVDLFASTRGTFPMLLRLSVNTKVDKVLHHLFHVMKRPLVGLHVRMCGGRFRDELPEISLFARSMDLLASGFARSLQRLSFVDERFASSEEIITEDDTSRALEPLFRISFLRVLVMNSPYALFGEDQRIGQVAAAWPQMKILSLESCSPQSGCTLSGLDLLLKKCPDLRRLHLVLRLHPPETQDIEGSLNTSIRRIEAGSGSSISKPLQLSRYISKFFPNLRRIEAENVHCHLAHKCSRVRRPPPIASPYWNDLNVLLGGNK